MKNFIYQANLMGHKRQPFVFIIDFERKKPLIFSLDQAANNGLFFNFNHGQQTNENELKFSSIPANFIFEKDPISLEKYRQGFDIVKKNLHWGNSYLLNLTYPTKVNTNYNFAQIFMKSQAKYKLLLENSKDNFVCLSPEPFIKIQAGKIYSYPMKGTINANLINADKILLENPKELAEHYTIVDLLRNDLALVGNNIEVKKFRYLEKLSSKNNVLWQTSSEIVGDINHDWFSQIGEILMAVTPAGSISGAPKVKTLQIISQAEGLERGYYTGVCGIFDGEKLDSAVIIRYLNKNGEKVYFHSGGGITLDSDINDEYQELIDKVYLPF